MARPSFNWIIGPWLWSMAERGFSALVIGWGGLLLLPGPTFSIAHTWHFLALSMGSTRWGDDTAEVVYGCLLLMVGIHQLVQLRRDNRKWRQAGMFLFFITFLTRFGAFLAANIAFGEVGTGWWDNLCYTVFAAISFFMMGAAWSKTATGTSDTIGMGGK